MSCIFCQILNKEIESNILYEDDEVISFLDINQTKPGHSLIIPKKHIQDIKDADEKIISHMFNIAKLVNEKLMTRLGFSGTSYVINYGTSQEIKHLHLHICPNYTKEIKLTTKEIMAKLK